MSLTESAIFPFGSNWGRYLSSLSDQQIESGTRSLCEMLDVQSLSGSSFLDVGSGSGLFSLAAYNLGATVFSFDRDRESVACTEQLKGTYAAESKRWKVESGSILDSEYIRRLGAFDTVYSWGVLHHTGDMWTACENAASLVKPGGKLFIAIYNDQGVVSQIWHLIKRIYNLSPKPLQWLLVVGVLMYFELRHLVACLFKWKLPWWIKQSAAQKELSRRGMSRWYDMVDWVGGYPFEVATPDEMIQFYQERGFTLKNLVTRCRHGCNEFVFQREPSEHV